MVSDQLKLHEVLEQFVHVVVCLQQLVLEVCPLLHLQDLLDLVSQLTLVHRVGDVPVHIRRGQSLDAAFSFGFCRRRCLGSIK